MKRFLLHIVTALLLWPGFAVAASGGRKEVKVDNLEIIQANRVVVARFDLHIGKRAARNTESLIITPVLRRGTNELSLLPVVVEGKRARVTAESRARTEPDWLGQPPVYTKNGETVSYRFVFPWQEWMAGADLLLDGVGRTYYDARDISLGLIAGNLFAAQPVEIVEVVPPPVIIIEPGEPVREIPSRLSTADELAQRFPFVAPVSEFEKARQTPSGGLFDYNMPLNLGKGLTNRDQDAVVRFVNGAREGALTIRFRQGSRVINREFEDNNRTLVDLVSVIRAIEESSDSRVARIVIAGFASPEGLLSDNEKLAWDRAAAVRDFLVNNSPVSVEIVHTYNGSIDWEGLRKLVAESNMPEKEAILRIIDSTPVWDGQRNTGRHGELMRLAGGEPYKYMLQYFFPQLRQAAYIKVYYENR